MARHSFPMPRGGGQDLPRAGTLPSAKASRHGARAKKFAPRKKALLGESLPTRRTGERICPREKALLRESIPTRRTSERICPAQERSPRRRPPDTARERKDLPARERSPRRRPPDTAHERKDLCRTGTRPSEKASRHGARAKRFAPRRNTLLGEGLPTRRTSERICPAQEHAPRRKPTDTAHERKDLPRAGTRPSAKTSRHGARAKGFAPRRNALLGEGLPTRRTGERICPAQKRPHGEGLPTRRTGERVCPAQERSPRRRPPDTAHERKDLPRGVRVRPTCRRTAGRSRPTNSRKNTPSAGSHPRRRGRCRVHSPKKIRLLHEIQFFHGESHVGSRQIFPSFPSVDRCVARERNPVPPFAPHCGSGHRGLRRDG